MIVLSAKDITKVYGTDVIISGISFHVNKGDCLGIVGVNGAGKTTLLNILSGDIEADEGEFFVAKELSLGYLKQRENFRGNDTVIEAISKVEGYDYESEVTGMLKVMSFSEDMFHRPVSSLSGGEQERLALACLLLSKPDILLLDEPTNHLDVDTIRWLEQYIRAYKGTVILVSHDRYFLDKTVNKIMEISHHKGKVYLGNYSDYAIKRRAVREAEMNAYDRQQREIARQEEMIRRFKERGTSKLAKRAASREKRLAHMSGALVEKPEPAEGRMKLTFKEAFPTGKDVLLGKDVAIGYGREPLFSGFNFDIKRGERIAISGPNGIGKTTFLKVIVGQMRQMSGVIKVGHNVVFGYYDQGQRLLNDGNTVLEEVHSQYRLYKESEIRGLLGRFLFKGEDVFLRVGDLSGGEKARLSLLKLMMSGANVLVLDEPTNHLDIDSKEAFEDALLEFPGTILVVSHDRYFLDKVPTRELHLGQFTDEPEKEGLGLLTSSGAIKMTGAKEPESSISRSAEERAAKKEQQAEERRRAREKDRLEKEIHKMEKEIKALREEMCLPENLTDFVKLRKLDEKVNETQLRLDEFYEKWLEY